MPSPMTRTQVCQSLGVSPKSLYVWERDGKIPTPERNRRGWRMYSPDQVEAIRRYLDSSDARPAEPAVETHPEPLGGLSARNQIRGTVASIDGDGILCEVVLRLCDGQEIVSVVTRSSVRRLGLKVGEEALAVIKSTEVMLFR